MYTTPDDCLPHSIPTPPAMGFCMQKLSRKCKNSKSTLQIRRDLERLIFLLYLRKKLIIMGVGGIVIASSVVCIVFLLLAEFQERYL